MADLLEQKIADLITPSVESMGYEIVRVKLFDGAPKTLQIMAERSSDHDLNVDDCEKISRSVSAIMDVEDPISDEYNLEVSSPGIDRPLVRLKDFSDYKDFEAKIITSMPIEGRKRYKGRLLGVDKANNIQIKLNENNEEFAIPFSEIASAKLVLTDELINKVVK